MREKESDPIEPMMRSVLARNTEAVAHAHEIAEKVRRDNREGWYHIERPQPLRLQSDPDYLKNGAATLQKTYGQKLAAFICGLDTPSVFGRWVRGTLEPNQFQKVHLRNAIEITEILLAKLTPKQAKEWWTTPNAYILGWLPMDEIGPAPDLVRRAALTLFL